MAKISLILSCLKLPNFDSNLLRGFIILIGLKLNVVKKIAGRGELGFSAGPTFQSVPLNRSQTKKCDLFGRLFPGTPPRHEEKSCIRAKRMVPSRSAHFLMAL